MQKLGGKVVSVENGKLSSSSLKGETLHDTLVTMSKMVDAIVVRTDVGNIANQVNLDQIRCRSSMPAMDMKVTQLRQFSTSIRSGRNMASASRLLCMS